MNRLRILQAVTLTIACVAGIVLWQTSFPGRPMDSLESSQVLSADNHSGVTRDQTVAEGKISDESLRTTTAEGKVSDASSITNDQSREKSFPSPVRAEVPPRPARVIDLVEPAPPDPGVRDMSRDQLLSSLSDEMNIHAGRLSDRASDILKALKEQGAAAQVVDHLSSAYWSPADGISGNVIRKTLIIKSLEQLGTAEASELLLEIGTKEIENAGSLGPRAVRAFSELSNDADQMIHFLDSADARTRDAAISAMSNSVLSEQASARLAQELGSSSITTHQLVASAFGSANSPQSADIQAKALLAHYDRVESLEFADRPGNEGGFPWTRGEETRQKYLGALAVLSEAEGTMRQMYSRLSASKQQAISYALAYQNGDRNSKLLQIAQSSSDPVIRYSAIASLSLNLTDVQAAQLQTIAESDAFHRAYTSSRSRAEVVEYPVRKMARSILDRSSNR